MAKAKQLASKTSLKEQVLIEALSARYSEDLTADIPELNMNYMHAMTKAAKQFPTDANIQILLSFTNLKNTYPGGFDDGRVKWNKVTSIGAPVISVKLYCDIIP